MTGFRFPHTFQADTPVDGRQLQDILDVIAAGMPMLRRRVLPIEGDGVATVFTVTHGLGTPRVVVQVWDDSSSGVALAGLDATETTLTVTFAVAPPALAEYEVVVIG